MELLVDDRPVGPLAIAATRRARARGLLGRGGVDGALLLMGVRSVHTVGMRFAIDVATCDDELVVVAVRTMVEPGRLVLPRRRARHILEAEAGAFERWGLGVGCRLAAVG